MTDEAQFSDLCFAPHLNPAFDIQARMFFPNGYGVSVIRGEYSYGGSEGLYELAVLRGDEAKFRLTYDTPITDDVIGYLSENEVTDLMRKVAAL